MTPSQLIALLNTMTCGDLDSLSSKLHEARKVCLGMGEEGLAAMVLEAREALVAGDLKTYRKRVETVVSRLGHLRSKPRGSHPGMGTGS